MEVGARKCANSALWEPSSPYLLTDPSAIIFDLMLITHTYISVTFSINSSLFPFHPEPKQLGQVQIISPKCCRNQISWKSCFHSIQQRKNQGTILLLNYFLCMLIQLVEMCSSETTLTVEVKPCTINFHACLFKWGQLRLQQQQHLPHILTHCRGC